MSTELVKQDQGAVAPRDTMSVVAAAAADSSVDAAKMKVLQEILHKEQDRTAEQAFNAAMVACQAEIPQVLKRAKTNNGTYARLEDMDREIRPVYQAHGFAVMIDSPTRNGNEMTFTATVIHSAGHSRPVNLTLDIDSQGAKNGAQKCGSTVAYGRRYLLKMAFNIVEAGEDTDGNRPRQEPTLTQDQQDTIQTWLTDQKRDRAKFFAFVSQQAGREVTTLAQIPQRLYSQIVQAFKGAR